MPQAHESTSPLRSLGIVGWDDIELTVVSALMAKLTPLFVGLHGSTKTDGARAIAEAILGDQLKFSTYECPNLQTDDLVGIPNPKSLDTGVLDFIGTNISVWNVNAAVLDEVNRVPSSTASKLMELVRNKTIYGMPTGLHLVFATANPPSKEYVTHRLDVALASRFVIVEVPAYHELSEEDAVQVLRGRALGGRWPWFHYPDVHGDEATVLSLHRLLMQHGVRISGRQAKSIQKLLACAEVAAHHGCLRTPRTLALLVLSCVPEASGLCTVQVDRSAIMMALELFFETRLASALPDPSDWPAYLSAMTARVHACASVSDAQVLLDQIPALKSTTDHDEDIQHLLVDLVPTLLRYPPSALQLKSMPDLLEDIFT